VDRIDDPIVQLSTRGAQVCRDDSVFEPLAQHYAHTGYARLPGLLDRELLAAMFSAISACQFRLRDHDGAGTELCLPSGDRPVRMLDFIVNCHELFRVIERITGCGRIGNFSGRIFQGARELHDYDVWHDDVREGRLAAMSVNLSERPYEGGALQLRDRGNGAVVSIDNPVPGDAVIFRIAPDLQHRITAITSAAPRTAFAGWFRSTPDALEQFRRLESQALASPENSSRR
jgi:hypothetical protein